MIDNERLTFVQTFVQNYYFFIYPFLNYLIELFNNNQGILMLLTWAFVETRQNLLSSRTFARGTSIHWGWRIASPASPHSSATICAALAGTCRPVTPFSISTIDSTVYKKINLTIWALISTAATH